MNVPMYVPMYVPCHLENANIFSPLKYEVVVRAAAHVESLKAKRNTDLSNF